MKIRQAAKRRVLPLSPYTRIEVTGNVGGTGLTALGVISGQNRVTAMLTAEGSAAVRRMLADAAEDAA